jgi:protease IV
MAMSSTRKALLIIGGCILALVVVAVIGLAIMISVANQGPSVENNSVLVLRIGGDMPDFAPEDPTARLFGVEPKNSFAGVLTQLRKAKVDKRIGGILLDVEFAGFGWGKADELREAIADFKTSGKPVYAYMEVGTNKEYYIAAAADKIFLPPTGDIYINGFAAQAQFYKGSLDKLGIEWQNVAIGKYKSANERFVRKDLSPESREVLNAIIDDYYNRMINTVAEARKKSPEDVKALIDGAPYNAVQAKELNLIDGASYRDQVYSDLKKQLGYGENEELKTIASGTYREVSPESLGLNNGEKVAVIFASGVILSGRSSDGSFGGEQTIGSDTVVKAVRDAADDTTVKAIVLRVDSPGGSALASDLMWHAIEYAKTKKPVVTSMSDVAASGGYYIATNSNKIVAQPSTLTGSIGVILGKPAVGGLYEWLGVSNEYVTRGKNSEIFREDRKWTEEEQKVFERSANFFYWDNFVTKVAKGRGRSTEEIHNVAQGRVWTGLQAKERGLVDEFGGLNKAVDIAKQLANLPAEKDVRRVIYPAPKPFLATLFEKDEEATVQAQKAAMIKTLPEDLQKAMRFAALYDRMKRGETMALMPFELEIK